MGDFRELRVYRESVELVVVIYRVTGRYPGSERYGLTSQLRRAGVSVPANIAEGWGRGTRKQQRYFYEIARGSAREIDCLTEIAGRLEYPADAGLNARLARVQFMLSRLIAALEP